jgi:hypothetical protein
MTQCCKYLVRNLPNFLCAAPFQPVLYTLRVQFQVQQQIYKPYIRPVHKTGTTPF